MISVIHVFFFFSFENLLYVCLSLFEYNGLYSLSFVRHRRVIPVSVVFTVKWTVPTLVQNNELVASQNTTCNTDVRWHSAAQSNATYFSAKLVDSSVVGFRPGKQHFPSAHGLSTLSARASFILWV